MLSMLCSGCANIAAGVKVLTDLIKYIIQMNYELVAMVIETIAHIVTKAIYIYGYCKQFIMTMYASTLDFLLEAHMVFLTILTAVCRFVSSIYTFLQMCFAIVIMMCLSCANYVSTIFVALTNAVVSACDFLLVSFDIAVSVIITVVSAFCLAITTVGSCCVHFVTGVWHGLGFVVSSVALFPTTCFQSLRNLWMKIIESFTEIVNVTTKETYLGIVVLCLLYLILSNTYRYLYSKGLSLFPRRIRRRRARVNDIYWQFDRGFESDFDDVYSSDVDESSVVTLTEADNDDSDDAVDSDTNDHDSNNSANVSDADDDSDSEEYTIVTEESDSDTSVISQTFSNESSDHEIEVQLPPVDKCYSLCSRSSTPSRISKTMNSPEEFDREMERERDKRKCVICQDQIKSVLVLPCKHMCMCVLCADQIVRSRTIGRRVCPLCRTKITKVMNIYV